LLFGGDLEWDGQSAANAVLAGKQSLYEFISHIAQQEHNNGIIVSNIPGGNLYAARYRKNVQGQKRGYEKRYG
jgi:hypothetical protein